VVAYQEGVQTHVKRECTEVCSTPIFASPCIKRIILGAAIYVRYQPAACLILGMLEGLKVLACIFYIARLLLCGSIPLDAILMAQTVFENERYYGLSW